MPVILDNAVDWEMSIYGTHFVSESLGYSSDHIIDQGPNRSKASDVLPTALPNSQRDFWCLPFQYPDIHVDMSDVLGQGATGTSNRNETGFYYNINAVRDSSSSVLKMSRILDESFDDVSGLVWKDVFILLQR